MLFTPRLPAVGGAFRCPGGLVRRGLPTCYLQCSGVYPCAPLKIVSNPRDPTRWRQRLTATAYCRENMSMPDDLGCTHHLVSVTSGAGRLPWILTISRGGGAGAICSAPSAHVLTELRSRPRMQAIFGQQTRR
jgi:hypothetical protein